MQDLEIYNSSYAEKYLKTIRSTYTQLKSAAIADEVAEHLPTTTGGPLPKPRHLVLDIGGNINGTVKHGLRGALERRSDNILYVPLDLSPAYFDAHFLKSKDPQIDVYPTSNG